MEINVLGTKYSVYERTKAEDKELNNCDGYCDKTTKTIVIINEKDNINLGNFEVYQKKILRHEIIHAFLFESGLHENWEHHGWGHDETFIDWFSVQFPKLLKAFKEVDCL